MLYTILKQRSGSRITPRATKMTHLVRRGKGPSGSGHSVVITGFGASCLTGMQISSCTSVVPPLTWQPSRACTAIARVGCDWLRQVQALVLAAVVSLCAALPLSVSVSRILTSRPCPHSCVRRPVHAHRTMSLVLLLAPLVLRCRDRACEWHRACYTVRA